MPSNNKRTEEIKNDALIATLEGHTGTVWGVAVSPDGDKIVSGCDDNTIKVWDSLNYLLLSNLEGHTDSINAVVIAPDGKRIISGSRDNTLRVWDCINYLLLATIKGHSDSVNAVSVTPDGMQFVSSSSDKTIKIWDSKSYQLLATLEGHTNTVCAVATSPDGKQIVSGGWDKTIKVWDSQSYQSLATLEGHTDSVWTVVFTPDGKRIISGSGDNTIKVWDSKSYQLLATLEGHTDSVHAVTVTPDGKRIVSGSIDNVIKMWDRQTYHVLATLECHTDSFRALEVTKKGKRVLLGSGDKKVKKRDCRDYQLIATLEGHTHYVNAIAIMPDGERIISGSSDSRIKVWDISKVVQQDSHSDLYTAAKVVLVGETGVGKSGLMIRLIEDAWRETGSTHGMNIKKIPFQAKIYEPFEKEIWLWDFAGQQDYKLIHQLFLANTSLGLLIYNPQDPKTLETLSEWDATLSRAINPRPPLLLIAGRCDVGSSRESDATMQQFMKQHNFIDYHKTSAKSGNGCDELKKNIIESIPWDKLPVTSSPKRFKTLKENIYNLANTESLSPLIPDKLLVEKLLEMSQNDPFEMAELNTVLKLWEAQGLLFELPYGELWLLKPELLNAYASSILLTARKDSEVGCIDKAKIVNAELEFEQLGESRLPKSDEKLLLPAILQLMGDRQISLQEETNDGDKIIFPAVFRIARPAKPKIPSLAAIYQFEGLVDDIYASLVVRLYYSKRFIKQAIWKDAADFVTAIGSYPIGIALVRKGDAKAELQVYFEGDTPEEERSLFRRFIFEHLTRKSSETPASVPLYFCPYCNWQIPQETATKRLQAGRTSFTCADCDKNFAIALALESQPITKPEADALGAMNIAIHNALDNRSKALLQTGEVMVQVALTNQIFRLINMEDVGVDAEIELLDDAGLPTSKRIYLQLKSGDSNLRKRVNDSCYSFRIKNERILRYYRDSIFIVLLVVRPSSGDMRFINITKYLRDRAKNDPNKENDLTISFDGKPFTANEILQLRKEVLNKNNKIMQLLSSLFGKTTNKQKS